VVGIPELAFLDDRGEPVQSDDDLLILEAASFVTPPPRQTSQGAAAGFASGGIPQQPAICQFSILDFTPRAPEPNPYLWQAIGEYLPWLHNCGEDTCPFTEPPAWLQEELLETGMPLPNSCLSPGDHIRVDKKAFTEDIHVKVKLEVLGFDRGLWGDLDSFTGLVVDRYYQEVTGAPMFTVDFRGSIGKREVKVCDSVVDETKRFGSGPQRALDFGSPSNSQVEEARGAGVGGSSQSTIDVQGLHPLHPAALLLCDSDADDDWVAEFEDFPPEDGAGKSPLTFC
jgi:hypothetical protein